MGRGRDCSGYSPGAPAEGTEPEGSAGLRLFER